MRRVLFIGFLYFVSAMASAQLDSLKQILSTKMADSTRTELYIQVAKSYYNEQGILDSSLHYYSLAADLAKKTVLPEKYARAINGKALIFREKGIYQEALKNSLEALTLAEKIKDTAQITASLNGIAIVNQIQKDFDKAFEYYKKCERIHELRKSKTGLASTYNNLGLLFADKNEPAKSLSYFTKALEYNEEADNIRGVATNCENIGLHYLNFEHNPDLAIQHFQRSVSLWREMNDQFSVSITLDYMVAALFAKGEYKKGLDTAYLSLKLGTEAGSPFSIAQAHEKLYKAHEKLNNIDSAYVHFKKYISYSENLKNDDKLREITQMQLNYEHDKKDELDSLQQQLNEKVFSDRIEKQNIIIWAGAGFLVIVLVLGFVIWKSYLRNKQAKNEIALQKDLLEEQNKNIVDSIKYARHIQLAILPPDELVNKLLPGNFVLYLPKDIVSGDFYWVKEKGNKIYLAVVDCTGHGVPGAFMSIVGRNGLTELLNTLHDPTAAEMLDHLNEYVNESLNQTMEHSTIRDGMDISLCIIDRTKNTLQFAGANNPIWVINNNRKEWQAPFTSFAGNAAEIKADKQPIGNFAEDAAHPFTNHEFRLTKGDAVYLFTDGYADQFGGPKGKKLKYKQLQQLLLSLCNEKPEEQKVKIESYFMQWKGNFEQVDDVCILGIRFD